MYEVKIDGVEALAKKFDAYLDQLTGLQTGIPDTMLAWQKDDMKRHYPTQTVTTTDNEVSVTTVVLPRSRLPSKDQQRKPRQKAPKGPRILRGPKAYRMPGGATRPASTRPILRPELLTRLYARTDETVNKATRWP